MDKDTAIIPSFLVIDPQGYVTFRWTEAEDWDQLSVEMGSWIGTDRLEVVRYTQPLNALSKKLNLPGKHLVFLTSRNGFSETEGDNMPATILYDGGYPLYGKIIIALETDGDYEIEGFRLQNLLFYAFFIVNDAVGGLLRTK